MHFCLKTIVFTGALALPSLVVSGQERRDAGNRNQTAEQSRRYEDKAHNDTHEWNQQEDQKYRQYLQERRKKYHDFRKASRKEQNDYWNWRHGHPAEDRR